MSSAPPCPVSSCGTAASLADARRACVGFEAGVVAHPPSHRLASVVVHPPRLIAPVDADGFQEIISHRHCRHQRRPCLDTHRPVPPSLEGKCFNCLVTNHVQTQCRSLPCCFCCKTTGHRVRQCRRSTTVATSTLGQGGPRQSASTAHRCAGDATMSGLRGGRSGPWPKTSKLGDGGAEGDGPGALGPSWGNPFH